jgi:galactokinase
VNWTRWLEPIYGDTTNRQVDRYQTAMGEFDLAYGRPATMILRSPGRVNLIGEHTDYQQGYVFPVALDKDFALLLAPRTDGKMRLTNMERGFSAREFEISESIPSGPKGDWGNYGRGAAQILARVTGRALKGADVLISGAQPYGVPRGAGLSSSSALTVGAAIILAAVNDLEFSPAELAWLCGEAEWYVGTRGGIMDQFIALLGQRGHALFLDCRATSDASAAIPTFRTEQVPLPPGYEFIVADTKTRHQNVRSDFNVRVLEGRIGVALLQREHPAITHLRDLEGLDWATVAPLLPESMGWDDLNGAGLDVGDLIDVELPRSSAPFLVRQRCRHIVTENARVLTSAEALRAGDIAGFGELMNQAHTSVSLDYGASCDELEALTRLARQVDGVLGARMTGAGWGGCVVSLAKEGCEHAFRSHVRPNYHEETGLWPDIFVCRASSGAGVVADLRG